ncbi:hypothetical protein ACWELJ_10110 [Nocardia sp. NPDC004582]
MSELGRQWTQPVVCDRCPHPISEHTVWKPDERCGALVGEIVLHSERLDIINKPDQVLFTYRVVPGSPSDAGLRKLA